MGPDPTLFRRHRSGHRPPIPRYRRRRRAGERPIREAKAQPGRRRQDPGTGRDPGTPVAYARGARSDTEPLERCEIEPDIASVFPAAVGSGLFTVRVVSPKRTFIKKAMLLHEQACRKTPKPPRARLSRHYYDIYCLIGAGIADAALATEGLFANVVRHRAIYFPESLRDGYGYDSLTPAGLRLRPDPGFMSDWRADYQKMRESMFYGASPEFDEVMREVGRFEDGLRGR
jgi:hypothetical protein